MKEVHYVVYYDNDKEYGGSIEVEDNAKYSEIREDAIEDAAERIHSHPEDRNEEWGFVVDVEFHSEPSNMARAEAAYTAIHSYEEIKEGRRTREPTWSLLADFLCDAMHLAKRDGFDFDEQLATARMNFEHEKDSSYA